jgi:hypothetical protein
MSKRFPTLLLSVFFAGSVVAMPTMAGNDRPWAEIRIGGIADNDRDEYDVLLIAINGSRDIGTTSRYEVPPGIQQLRVASRKRGKSGEIVSYPLTLEMKPCVRYELVANHSASIENQGWRAEVKSESEIKSCAKKFGALPRATAATADAGS